MELLRGPREEHKGRGAAHGADASCRTVSRAKRGTHTGCRVTLSRTTGSEGQTDSEQPGFNAELAQNRSEVEQIEMPDLGNTRSSSKVHRMQSANATSKYLRLRETKKSS